MRILPQKFKSNKTCSLKSFAYKKTLKTGDVVENMVTYFVDVPATIVKRNGTTQKTTFKYHNNRRHNRSENKCTLVVW